MPETALVTGAAGFIGSHLCDYLLRHGLQVKAVDSLKYGSWKNLSDPSNKNLSLIEKDFSTFSGTELRKLLQDTKYLFHLGAEKHNNAIEEPDIVCDVNVAGTSRLFEAAGEAAVEKVIFSSSLYANGRTSLPTLSESEAPVPSTTYGVSKLAGEGLLRGCAKRFGFQALAFRLFFNYGPRQYPGLGYPSVIVRNFMRLADGLPPIIKNDGAQELDYIFVEDTLDAFWKAAQSDISFDVLNLGSGVGTSISKLTSVMQEVVGTNFEPQFRGTDWTGGTKRVSNQEKTKTLLNWSANTSLEEGIEKVWGWFKTQVQKKS